LVNNAGINLNKLAVKTKSSEFSHVLDINLTGAFNCSREVISSSMLARRHGRIINISSLVGQIGNAGQASYGASKAGLIGLTKSLAKEYGPRGICVNAVCPGFITTDMTKDIQHHDLIKSIPLRRFGKPEEVAGLVSYLALDDSAQYITGHCFNIDGGLGIGAS
jgi:3-oxoacyl-[acyl-carrier protein] reductase